MRLISTKTSPSSPPSRCALTLAACGNKKSSTHGAETEGIYLNVGKLKYQVEISRQLNPAAIPEDKTFVQGIVPDDATLGPDEIWFSVFVRVENETDQAQTPASSITITDTEGNTYSPVKFDASNEFAYTDDPVRAHSYVPNPDSIPAQVGSIGGLQLLFKLKRQSLDDRPLELHIKSFFPDDEATDTLDV